jgi:hypothetical protein
MPGNKKAAPIQIKFPRGYSGLNPTRIQENETNWSTRRRYLWLDKFEVYVDGTFETEQNLTVSKRQSKYKRLWIWIE